MKRDLKRVCVMLDKETNDRLEAASQLPNSNRSAIVRASINFYLDKQSALSMEVYDYRRDNGRPKRKTNEQ